MSKALRILLFSLAVVVLPLSNFLHQVPHEGERLKDWQIRGKSYAPTPLLMATAKVLHKSWFAFKNCFWPAHRLWETRRVSNDFLLRTAFCHIASQAAVESSYHTSRGSLSCNTGAAEKLLLPFTSYWWETALQIRELPLFCSRNVYSPFLNFCWSKRHPKHVGCM